MGVGCDGEGVSNELYVCLHYPYYLIYLGVLDLLAQHKGGEPGCDKILKNSDRASGPQSLLRLVGRILLRVVTAGRDAPLRQS